MTTLNPSNFKVGAGRRLVMGNPEYKVGLIYELLSWLIYDWLVFVSILCLSSSRNAICRR